MSKVRQVKGQKHILSLADLHYIGVEWLMG